MRRLRAVVAAKWAAVGTAALVGTAFALAPVVAAADSPQPRTAADCRAISDFNLRGQCWDSLDKTSQQETQATKKREFGLPMHLPSVAAILPRKEDLAREAKRDSEDVKDQTLTLAEVGTTPLGRLLLTSSDGAIWEQTDGDLVPQTLEPGDSVEVSKGMMGGYMCHVTHWQAVRCQRDR